MIIFVMKNYIMAQSYKKSSNAFEECASYHTLVEYPPQRHVLPGCFTGGAWSQDGKR